MANITTAARSRRMAARDSNERFISQIVVAVYDRRCESKANEEASRNSWASMLMERRYKVMKLQKRPAPRRRRAFSDGF
jgi:hypothetical protein